MCVASARCDGGGAGAQGLSGLQLKRIPQTQWGDEPVQISHGRRSGLVRRCRHVPLNSVSNMPRALRARRH
ncbi:hypothetical protein XACS582_14650007 [Xanthomonas citri pv. citri]|nr:hypothetical protein XACLD7_14980005 [Xanthomonas citri pv. citri]CEH61648.1 hypothetical protein XACS582_14650007 [Xanthomonas citri pv. citri]CEH83766.1 hypothetical protein XACB302_10770016 [Xanthomonas citri pv. citri]CEJ21721.1 hypothetical protein XACE116_12560004 [Xanthomonas citri pv. citri]CEJ26311.1 hypothetical protein XACE116_12560004 [Xanthomonas citri pv. citri]